MRPTATALSALCAVAILAAGCSTPQSHFYTLSRTAPPATAPTAPTALNVSVVVGPVSIPAMVDLPQIVVNTGPNQVTLDEFNRWASPLPNNIARVVAEILQRTGSYVPIFIIASSAYLVALLLVHLLSPRLEPARIDV